MDLLPYYSPLTTHYSLLPTPYSLLTTYYSHYSLRLSGVGLPNYLNYFHYLTTSLPHYRRRGSTCPSACPSTRRRSGRRGPEAAALASSSARARASATRSTTVRKNPNPNPNPNPTPHYSCSCCAKGGHDECQYGCACAVRPPGRARLRQWRGLRLTLTLP